MNIFKETEPALNKLMESAETLKNSVWINNLKFEDVDLLAEEIANNCTHEGYTKHSDYMATCDLCGATAPLHIEEEAERDGDGWSSYRHEVAEWEDGESGYNNLMEEITEANFSAYKLTAMELNREGGRK